MNTMINLKSFSQLGEEIGLFLQKQGGISNEDIKDNEFIIGKNYCEYLNKFI